MQGAAFLTSHHCRCGSLCNSWTETHQLPSTVTGRPAKQGCFTVWSLFELLSPPRPPAGPPAWGGWGLWGLRRALESRRSPPQRQCPWGRCNPENPPVSSSWGGWAEWSPASLAGSERHSKVTRDRSQRPAASGGGFTFTLAVVVRGTWPEALAYSLFSCAAWPPTRAEKAVARWRRKSVFWGGIFNSRANVSELKRGSRIWGGAKGVAGGQRVSTHLHRKEISQHSQSARHERRCPAGWERILPDPPTWATPSRGGWTTAPPLKGRGSSGGGGRTNTGYQINTRNLGVVKHFPW